MKTDQTKIHLIINDKHTNIEEGKYCLCTIGHKSSRATHLKIMLIGQSVTSYQLSAVSGNIYMKFVDRDCYVLRMYRYIGTLVVTVFTNVKLYNKY